MVEFAVNPNRVDPYKTFKFRVLWDGQVVAGVSKVGALKRTTEVVEHREGGDNSTSHKSPGRTKFEPITLERGLTHDPAFEAWADKVGGQVSLADFRKDVRLELLNEAGQVVKAWQIFRCWPSAYQAVPDLDANAAAVAFEMLVLENEGWERDTAVVEPEEPSLARRPPGASRAARRRPRG
jgi:phage tail-like protein